LLVPFGYDEARLRQAIACPSGWNAPEHACILRW
jgi:hypothetical protein